MALTSVVPSFLTSAITRPPTHLCNELSPNSLHVTPFHTSFVPAVNIPSTSLQHGGVTSEDAAAAAAAVSAAINSPGLIIPEQSLTAGCSTFVPNASYLPITNVDAYRFVHQTLNTVLGATGTAFTTAQLDPNGQSCCLLPTPSRKGPTGGGDGQLGRTQSGFVDGGSGEEPAQMSDDGLNGRLGAAQSETSLIASSQTVLFVRLLMSGKEVGSIIGKRGENVKKYREESGAKINISDGSSPERIVTVTGTSEQIFLAFTLMCQKFEDDFTQGLIRIGDEGVTCPPVTLRLLVPTTQCGSIIGKGGSRIKDVRELTGASIQVASEALPASTERTVTISGTARAIAKCVRHLCDIFIESPAKGPVIQYRPRAAFANAGVLCTNTTAFSPQVLHPGMVYSNSAASETASEQGFCTNGNLMVALPSAALSCSNDASAPPPMPSPIAQAYLRPMGMSSDCSTFAVGGGADGTSQPAVAATGANGAGASHSPSTVMADLIADPSTVTSAMGYPDFSTCCPWSLLNPAQFTTTTTGLIPGNVINPLSPALLFPSDCAPHSLLYTPANHAISYAQQPGSNTATNTATTNNNSLLLAGMPNLLRPGGPTTEKDNELVGLDAVADSANPFTALVHHSLNGYGVGRKSLTNAAVCCAAAAAAAAAATAAASTPFGPNKASLLGLPAATYGPDIGMQLVGSMPLVDDHHVMKEMSISNDLIGCIIGRGGTTVNEIRNLSKAQIKISNCEDGVRERKITLSGSIQAVNLAYFLINNRISAELFAGMMAYMNQ